MTREEITGKFLALATKCENKHDTMDLTLDLLEEYSNDFESRTCKNCKWYDGSHKCNNENSIAYGTSNRVYSYDGCREDFISTNTKGEEDD